MEACFSRLPVARKNQTRAKSCCDILLFSNAKEIPSTMFWRSRSVKGPLIGHLDLTGRPFIGLGTLILSTALIRFKGTVNG